MKAKFDSYYTPSSIADELISFCKISYPKRIADFAAGFGSLLDAAKLKYPNSQFFLNDISLDCIEYLINKNSDWQHSSIDFFDSEAIQQLLKNYFSQENEKFDLILLNPPFSHSGGSSKKVTLNKLNIKCSPALAFVINSLNFLKLDGEIIALLPAGCLTTDKDEHARKILNKYYNVTLEKKFSNKTFLGCSVNTICLRISRRSNISNSKLLKEEESRLEESDIKVKIFRGKIPVFDLESYSYPFGIRTVHTTNLKNGQITGESKTVSKNNSTIIGPCILIPRVCKPSLSKIVVYQYDRPITLTDCIIAIFPNSHRDLYLLYDVICSHLPLLELSYSGTCAQYITLNKLCAFFESINVKSVIAYTNDTLYIEEELLSM